MKIKDFIQLFKGKAEQNLIIRGQSGIEWKIDLDKTEIKNTNDENINQFTLIIK